MMSDTLKQDEALNQEQVKKNRWTLIAIMIVSILPITAAYLMFFTGIGVPQNTVNNGMLLPQPLSVEKLFEADDHAIVRRIEEEKKWRLFLPISASCNKVCEEILYTTRQVHIRLGEKSPRLERIAVNTAGLEGQALLDGLSKEHPKLVQTEINGAQWDAWISQSGADLDYDQQPYYLLVDQEGFAMMAYSTQHGNDLLKDIKHVLKASIDYQ